VGLSVGTLRRVIDEVAPAIIGGWIQKVFQPLPTVIVLEIRTPGQTHHLLFSADPQSARLHLTSAKLANPPAPPPFCQLLRARIQGARLERLVHIGQDRVAHLIMTAKGGPCTLIAQLTGRSADLLLVNGQQLILGSLRGGTAKSGSVYSPLETREFHKEPEEEPIAGPEEPARPYPLSAKLEARYAEEEVTRTREQAKQDRLSRLSKAIKKTKKRIEALRADLEKAERYREYGRYGELLKANLGQVQKGQDTITLVDYFDPAMPELQLPLDPSKGPQGNLMDYFNKHRKFKSAEETIRPRLLSAERELATMQEERQAIQQGNWESRGTAAEGGTVKSSYLTAPGHPRKKHRPQQNTGPFRRFTSADGVPIYVGRNARENDALTFKLAKSEDLWLHAHGTPGSHVVIRLEKGAETPPETLRDAATLALLYSDLKKSGKGEVIYARRKYVRKAKGQAPGAVTVTQEKAIFVTLDRTRLTRLKEDAARGEG
jgi:predicted ribosome quality control (RQC) complex YloA/Tae2 family protein